MKRSMHRVLWMVVLICFSAGCKKQLDINRDPNNPAVEAATPLSDARRVRAPGIGR